MRISTRGNRKEHEGRRREAWQSLQILSSHCSGCSGLVVGSLWQRRRSRDLPRQRRQHNCQTMLKLFNLRHVQLLKQTRRGLVWAMSQCPSPMCLSCSNPYNILGGGPVGDARPMTCLHVKTRFPLTCYRLKTRKKIIRKSKRSLCTLSLHSQSLQAPRLTLWPRSTKTKTTFERSTRPFHI